MRWRLVEEAEYKWDVLIDAAGAGELCFTVRERYLPHTIGVMHDYLSRRGEHDPWAVLRTLRPDDEQHQKAIDQALANYLGCRLCGDGWEDY